MKLKKPRSYFTNVDRACVGCTEGGKSCIVVRSTDSEEEVAIILPLLEADRQGLAPFDQGYWIKR